MSITVRLWEDEELQKANTDEWLATLLMNKGTFNVKESKALYGLPLKGKQFKQRIFACYWGYPEIYDEPTEERVRIYAPNTRALKNFIEAEYNEYPNEIIEITTRFKRIELS